MGHKRDLDAKLNPNSLSLAPTSLLLSLYNLNTVYFYIINFFFIYFLSHFTQRIKRRKRENKKNKIDAHLIASQ